MPLSAGEQPLTQERRGPRPLWTVRRFEEVTSTNETILAAGEEGQPEWTVHLARSQTRGRGRGSHTWWSPSGGGLWMSVLLRPSTPPARLGGLALVAGAAVRSGLRDLGSRGVELYWPNDLYYRKRKLGGILGEVRHGAPRQGGPAGPALLVALGIGLNIDPLSIEPGGAEPPPGLRGSVAWLTETGCEERDPEAVAVAILSRLEPLYRSFIAGASIPGLVQGALSGLDREVRVRIPPGETFQARPVGIGEEGELIVDRGGALEGLRAAEVDYGC